jgi:hypothetical protein
VRVILFDAMFDQVGRFIYFGSEINLEERINRDQQRNVD